jgi:cell wall assembly regulator SMI1/predicted DNA-binding WGR domain protein
MAKRYFEFVEGTSSKFWEIWVDGTKVMTRYGRIGASGQTTEKDEGAVDKAKKLHDKLIVEKTKKGYVESGGGAAPAAAPAKAAPAGEFDGAIARIEKKAEKAGVELAAGASAEAISAAEKALGRTLPEEVVAFYRRHDGAGDDAIEGRELLSLKRMVKEWTIWQKLLEKGDFGGNDHGEPGPGVQKRWWIWEWVPVTYDGAGNHHVLDLAPGKGGTYGQILSFWHDEASRKVEGKGFLAWLEKVKWGPVDEDDGDDENDDDEEE